MEIELALTILFIVSWFTLVGIFLGGRTGKSKYVEWGGLFGFTIGLSISLLLVGVYGMIH